MRRSLIRRTALSLGGLVGLVLVTALPPALGYVADLRATDSHLSKALRRLEDADLRGALSSLLRAEITAARAARAAASPVQRAWTGSGPLADEAAGLDALVTAASDLAAAGVEFIGASDIARLSDIYSEGVFDLDAVARLGAAARAVAADLAHAGDRLESDTAGIDSAIDDRVTKALRRLRGLREGLGRVRTFMDMIPAFMGAEGQRRYLLALQSPSEARGGGGLIGVYGVLSLDDGRLDLSHVGPVEELVPERPRRVDAPRWFVQSYAPFGALRGDMRLANLSPNFPPTARVLLNTYSVTTNDALDGVIALDPLAIGELLRGTGPLRAPGWQRAINRSNVRRTLLHDIYRHFDYRERDQNEYLRGLIAAFMESLSSEDVDVGGLITGMGIATARQHLKVYTTDPFVQERLSELRVDGDYTRAGANVQVVFNNNFAASKVDFFLKRTVDTDVRLLDDGSASVEVTVSMTNEASDGKTVLVRPLNRALPFGTNHMLAGLIAPRGARPGRVTAEGRTVIQIPRMDADRPLTLQALSIAPGATEAVIYRYIWPRAWSFDDGRFTLTLWPQAAVRPDFFTLRVTAPPGLVWRRTPGWRSSAASQVATGGRLREPFEAVLFIE